MKNITQIVEKQRAYFRTGATLDIRFRKQMLRRFLEAFEQWESRLTDALWTDLHKSYEEAYLTEISIVKAEIKTHLRKLSSWSKKRRVSTPIKLFPS